MASLLRQQKMLIKYGFGSCSNALKLATKYSTRQYGSQLLRSYGLNHSNRACFSQCSLHTEVVCITSIFDRPHSFNNYHLSTRCLHVTTNNLEKASSKVETTVNNMKEKQKEKVEEILKEAAQGTTAIDEPIVVKKTTTASAAKTVPPTTPTTDPTKVVAAKKPLKTRIWEEMVHYYHGFRLLFIDIRISIGLVWRVLNGKTLTRRENKQLVRTTSDLFRLIPFSVFIIVPFMELLLPLFIKFFPGMLPSTFQTAKEREDKLKQSLQIKLEMAKFLQKTLDEMAPRHKEDHKSVEAKQFAEFFQKIKDPNEYVSNEEIIKYAKRFQDEITVDSLSREQLGALCRLLNLNTMGTTNFLRFQLRLKLRSLAADDREIAREGVNSLDLFELQQACKSRGMRAYGLTSERLRAQMQEWIDLSLNDKVPPILLLMSRALLVSDDNTTTDKLKETIRVLPDSVGAKAKAAIGESEGKIDNKTKLEIIKEEERKIKEEREEQREEEQAKAEVLVDKAPTIGEKESASVAASTAAAATAAGTAKVSYKDAIANAAAKSTGSDATTATTAATAAASKPVDKDEKQVTSKDVELLSKALKTLSAQKLSVEKEVIKDLKEELQDYQEDVEELREVRKVMQEPVHESRAAKQLYKKVNNMIGQLDNVLADLEKKHQQIQHATNQKDGKADGAPAEIKTQEQEELVRIDELMNTIKKLKQTSDESRLKSIELVLSKIDSDKDGVITVDEVLKVVEALSRDDVNLSEKQVEELIKLLDKEHIIEAEEKIGKAIARSMKEAKKAEDLLNKINELPKTDSTPELKETPVLKDTPNLQDKAPVLQDKATDLNVMDKAKVVQVESKPNLAADAMAKAAENQKEKILPSAATEMPKIVAAASTTTGKTPTQKSKSQKPAATPAVPTAAAPAPTTTAPAAKIPPPAAPAPTKTQATSNSVQAKPDDKSG